MNKVDFNVNKILADKQKRIEKAQFAVDVQVVKDSNFYAPEMDGTLKKSALKSKYGSGQISWDVPYAEEQYYGKPNKSKDKNPNARMKWFEEAKAQKKESWIRIANGKYNS